MPVVGREFGDSNNAFGRIHIDEKLKHLRLSPDIRRVAAVDRVTGGALRGGRELQLRVLRILCQVARQAQVYFVV